VSTRVKQIVWIGSSRKDLQDLPEEVRADAGYALYAAQQGETDPAAKPLRGFGGTRVMETVSRHDGDTFRAVYTAQLADTLYVLHCFQKKSKKGVATPQKDIDLIRRRLAEAERHHREKDD
jgi:phage-related protein